MLKNTHLIRSKKKNLHLKGSTFSFPKTACWYVNSGPDSNHTTTAPRCCGSRGQARPPGDRVLCQPPTTGHVVQGSRETHTITPVHCK